MFYAFLSTLCPIMDSVTVTVQRKAAVTTVTSSGSCRSGWTCRPRGEAPSTSTSTSTRVGRVSLLRLLCVGFFSVGCCSRVTLTWKGRMNYSML